MNQTTFTQKPLTARFLAAVTAVAMLLSAFPASFFAFSIAEAATPLTLFEAGFESDNFTEWSNDESPWITVAANGANGSTHRAEVSNTGGDSELRADFSTAGYKNIELTYYLKTNDFEAEDTIKIQYSIDGGNSWTTQKTLTDGVLDNRTTWTPHTLGLSALSGGNVDDQSGFQLRYLANLDSGNDTFKIDDVKITGEPIIDLTVESITPASGGNTEDAAHPSNTDTFRFRAEISSDGVDLADVGATFYVLDENDSSQLHQFPSGGYNDTDSDIFGDIESSEFANETGLVQGGTFDLKVTAVHDGEEFTKTEENITFGSAETPSAPTLDTPVDNATTTADVTLEWTQTDDGSFPNHDDSDYYYYYVEVASTSQFLSGDLVGNFGSELDTEIDQSGLSAGTYYWRVRATHDPDGDNDASNAVVSDFSETRSFTVENQSDDGSNGDGTGAADNAPTLDGVSQATGAIVLTTNESFIWTVDAADVDGDLFSLEIDHNLAGQLPEPTVYASSTNPYGSTAAENQFTTEGVVVTYDAGAEEWTIDFGEDITNDLVTAGGITFYTVLKDVAGNTWGSMYGSGSSEGPDSYGDYLGDKNTFPYTLSIDDSNPTGTISGSKWIYGPNDGEAGVGWEIMLYEQGEVYSLMSTTTTDTAGEYSFTELPYGDYLVCEESRDGFEQQFPNSDNSQSGDCVEEGNTGYLITINDDNQAVENKLFGNLPVEPRPLFTFSGTKSDADANGLDGWEFQLIVMSDGPEYTDIVATTTTDIYGNYEFEIYYEDLPGWAKEYPPIFLQESYVREVLQDGWEQVNVKLDDETLPERPEYELEEQVCYLTSEYFEIQLAEEGEAVDLKNSADCDFVNTQTTDEEEVEEEEDSSGGGGGSSSTGTRTDRFNDSSTVTTTPTPEPQVLGETTTNFCPFLTEYMQMGVQNDVMEVTKLQLFLNVFKSVYGGVENPITGTFGTMTDANVKAFQQHYSSEILDPWFARGIVPHNRPTGFVYKTTMWKINSMVCPDETVEPEFEGEDLNSNVAVN